MAAHAVADRLAHGLRLLVDLLEHERLVAALLRDLLVVTSISSVSTLDLGAVDEEARAGRRDLDHLAVERGSTRAASPQRNAATDEAMNISPSPTPTTSGVWRRTPASRSG